MKQLKKKAIKKVAIGITFLLGAFVLSIFIFPAAALLLFIGIIGSSTYIFSSISGIACPSCDKPYGVTMNILGAIDVPTQCISCHHQASD
ncbi:hypothetical protein [Endozoicomonas arenosclerae]|uniref:hypothetical protein n=1 Tax=Endozoicomonas arenosclerae TaxID=1633495 RepID=UPI000B30DF6B|nr:hypothetical protein [Endozoicomonas arenosclerae]